MKKLPKVINLAGLKINVVKHDGMVEQEGYIGRCDYVNQELAIDTKTCPKETTEQAFFHELIHWILFVMGEHKLKDNEKFVDLFAHLLYQALSSMEEK